MIILAIQNLVKSFGVNVVLRDVNLTLQQGERMGLVGVNGSGKSTLMNVLSGIYPYGTYDGNIIYNGEICKFNTIKDSEEKGIVIIHQELALIPYMTIGENMYLGNERGSSLSINWNETYGEAEKYLKIVGLEESSRTLIKDIGVGKQQLVEIAKALAKNAKLLILDEPTNHLDITSKEILENALNQYTGTVLYVSHDRYFINETASRILELTGNTLVNYIGNYDYYLEKKNELTRVYAPQAAEKTGVGLFGNAIASPADTDESDVKRDWKQQKEEQARERKRQNDLKKTEEQIQALETRDVELDELLAQPEVYSDAARCMELNNEKYEISQKLEKLYELWETLM